MMTATRALEILRVNSDNPVMLWYGGESELKLLVHPDSIVTTKGNLLIVQGSLGEQRIDISTIASNSIMYYAALSLLSMIDASFLVCMVVMFIADLAWLPVRSMRLYKLSVLPHALTEITVSGAGTTSIDAAYISPESCRIHTINSEGGGVTIKRGQCHTKTLSVRVTNNSRVSVPALEADLATLCVTRHGGCIDGVTIVENGVLSVEDGGRIAYRCTPDCLIKRNVIGRGTLAESRY